MAQPVLVAGARTPIGKLLGSLSGLAAPALGGTAVRAVLERAGITGDQVALELRCRGGGGQRDALIIHIPGA